MGDDERRLSKRVVARARGLAQRAVALRSQKTFAVLSWLEHLLDEVVGN